MAVPERAVIEVNPDDRVVVPMTWEEYERLGPDVRGEYIDGCLVVNSVGNLGHQKCLFNLCSRFLAACPPGYTAVTEWAWKPAGDEWIPDVMVCADAEPTAPRFTGVPDMLVEVLSLRRARDLVTKSHKYAGAGAPRYMVVDPTIPSIVVFELSDGAYVEVGSAEGAEEITVDFGVGTVRLRPDDLLT